MAIEKEELQLKDVLRNVLEEARMVLPGIQALFGFQLVAVFNSTFRNIPEIDKTLHLVALFLSICAIACLIAPAAYHRQLERHSASREFVDYASMMMRVGMIPLVVSLSLDMYVVTNVVTERSSTSLAAGLAAFLLLMSLWYAFPCWKKVHQSNVGPSGGKAGLGC